MSRGPLRPSAFQKRLQLPRPRRVAQFTQRLGFDLADAFARDVEFLADSSSVCSLRRPETEAQLDDLLLSGRESLQDVFAVSSRTLVSMIASTGLLRPTQRSSMRSPRGALSPSRPTGVSSDTGSLGGNCLQPFWDLLHWNVHAAGEISSLVGARPSSFSSSRVARRNLFILSFM